MPETVTCSLEELGSVLDHEADRMLDAYRARLVEAVSHVQVRLVGEVPRQTGALAESIRPYVGEPRETWSRGGGGGVAGAAEVEAALQGWHPGLEVGVATDAPYGRKILLHGGDNTGRRRKQRDRRSGARKGSKIATYSKKVPPGWVDLIVAEANRILEG